MARRIVIAADSFKGTASAGTVVAALAEGWRSARPEDALILVPMADGGEGTLDALAAAVPGALRHPVRVTGPDGRLVDAEWLMLPDGTAVVELAATSGIMLLDPLLPHDAHTIGFGEAIVAALDGGATRLLLAIGGSSSTDGGAGALSALGARFLDEHGVPVAPGNRGLSAVSHVDVSSLRPVPAGGAIVLSDVTNPLLGTTGAAAVYGPQKGAGPSEVLILDANLERLAHQLDADPAAPGAGAAGGVGYGLAAWGARVESGASAVADRLGLAAQLTDADLLVTGEGRFDEQSASGKVVAHLLSRAGEATVSAVLVAGLIEAPTSAFVAALSLTDLAGSVEAAMADPVRWLRLAGARLAADDRL